MGRLDLQSVTTAVAAVLAVLATAASVALVWATSELSEGTRLVARNAESVAVADDLELALLSHSRSANLAVVTGSQEHTVRREALEGELEALLSHAARLTGQDVEEERRVGSARAAIQRYWLHRQRLDEDQPPLLEIVRRIGPSLDGAVAAVRALREHNEAGMAEASAVAARLDRLANVIGATIGIAVGVLLAAMLLGMRRFVVSPLVGIREAITRWRAHETEGGGAPVRGLRETVEIARAFNDMSAELGRQRQAQLTFLAGVAHDLRNPLGALSMAAQTLRDEAADLGPGSSDVIAILLRQVERLNRMIGDLLDAVRIEAGDLELDLEPVDLREPVEEITRLHAPTSASHRLRLEMPEAPVWARADALRIEQVVGNLVSNAIKYSPDGGEVRIAVSAHEDEAWIEVSDEGQGIPSEDFDLIFEPFRRRRAAKDVAPGVGIGLSVVRRIVGAHHGEIDVRSELGRGSTFRVRLPAAGR